MTHEWRKDRFDRLAARVRSAGGILPSSVGELRDAWGAEKAGYLIRDDISQLLAQRGVQHLPERIPNDQRHTVFLYSPDTQAGALLAAAFRIAEFDAQDADGKAA